MTPIKARPDNRGQFMRMTTATTRRAYDGPALFSFGFRPFFLFGASWAALAVPLWVHSFLLGGSHAQQDVLEQLYLDAAMKADSAEDVRLILERVAGRHPVPPARRIGWSAAAHCLH